MSKEHRVHTRYATEVEGKMRLGHLEILVRTRNVSSGGICFMIDQTLPRGADVELEIALMFDAKTFSEALRLRARIVWCTQLGPDQWQVGASFYAISGESRRYLDLFVKYLKAAEQKALDREG